MTEKNLYHIHVMLYGFGKEKESFQTAFIVVNIFVRVAVLAHLSCKGLVRAGTVSLFPTVQARQRIGRITGATPALQKEQQALGDQNTCF